MQSKDEGNGDNDNEGDEKSDGEEHFSDDSFFD
jgi:hypothetical protein